MKTHAGLTEFQTSELKIHYEAKAHEDRSEALAILEGINSFLSVLDKKPLVISDCVPINDVDSLCEYFGISIEDDHREVFIDSSYRTDSFLWGPRLPINNSTFWLTRIGLDLENIPNSPKSELSREPKKIRFGRKK